MYVYKREGGGAINALKERRLAASGEASAHQRAMDKRVQIVELQAAL